MKEISLEKEEEILRKADLIRSKNKILEVLNSSYCINAVRTTLQFHSSASSKSITLNKKETSLIKEALHEIVKQYEKEI